MAVNDVLQTSEYRELIERDNMLTLIEFFQYKNFDTDRFNVSLEFWFQMNSMKDDEFLILTDDLINLIGFKASAQNVSHGRSHLLAFIRKHFQNGIDFLATANSVTKNSRGGAHTKFEIRMKKRAFKKMLIKVNTQTSDLIHDYILDFESIAVEFMRYQSDVERYHNARLKE
jgi:hypothetical protein